MKKFLAASLASAMVVSMAAASFAAVTNKVESVDPTAKLYSSTDKFTVASGKVAYGETVYYSLLGNSGKVTEYDAVRGTSIKQKWELNGTAIEKIEIVKKKHGDTSADYAYYVSVKTKDNTSTKDTDIVGTLSLRKSGNDGFDEISHPVNFTLGYTAVDGSTAITDKLALHSFVEDSELSISFTAADSNYFVVNTMGQGKLLAKADVKYNADIAAKYPTANLDFFNGNGVSFNKIGELTIAADKGSFLYAVNADGNLSAVKASYDEYEEAFKVKTRTLGQYVISDVELKVVTAPSTGTGKPNPGTGAQA